MFKNLGALSSLLKGAQDVRARMEQIQEQLRQKRVEGSAGGGMVVIEMNGKQDVVNCRIEPQLITQQDRELLEELVVAAVHQALEKSRALQSEEMSKLVGGLQIPGLTEALQQFSPSGPAS